jgi:maltose O-acetyltransferase
MLFDKLFSLFYKRLFEAHNRLKDFEYRKRFSIHPTARLHYIENIWFKGNITVGQHTYLNSARVTAGPNSKIIIGEWCAIGHNVTIISWTHDTELSTGPEDSRPSVEKDIIVGDNVWIGSNVFIREGVKIGNNSIIGANSLVIKDVPDYAIVGGVPAKLIKHKRSNLNAF